MTDEQVSHKLKDYWAAVNRVRGQRAGQAMFNVLERMRPDLAEKVRGTDFDPFYASSLEWEGRSKVDAFRKWLRDNWGSIHVSQPREVKKFPVEPTITAFKNDHGSPYCDKCTGPEHDGIPHFFHDSSDHTSWMVQMNSRAGED